MVKWFSTLRKLKSSLFVKNFLILFTGSSVSQLIPLIAIIFLVKMFPQDVLGVYFLFSSIVMVCSIVATLQYELAIVIPEKEQEGDMLFLLSLFVSFVVSVLLLLGILCWYENILSLFHLHSDGLIANWLYFIPLAVFFNGVIQSINRYFNRYGLYKAISLARALKSGGMATGQISFGVLKILHYGLFLGHVTGQLLGIIYLIWEYRRFFRRQIFCYKLRELWNVAKLFKNFPFFNTLISFTNSLSNHIPVFLFTRLLGPIVAAQYGVAHKTISSPVGLVGMSFSQLFIKEASERYNRREEIVSLVNKIQKSIFITSILPFTLIFFFAPTLFSFVLGEEWRDSGIMVSMLTPWLLVAFLNAPLLAIYSITENQIRLLLYNVILLIFRVLAIYMGSMLDAGFYTGVILYSVVGILFNGFLFIDLRKIAARATPKLG